MIKALVLFAVAIKAWIEILIIPIEIIVDIVSTYFILRCFVWDYFMNNKDFWALMEQQPNVLLCFLISGFFSSRIISAILRNSNSKSI